MMVNVLDYREAAAALGVSDRTVRRLVADGDLEAVNVRSSVRIPGEEIKRYIESHPHSTKEK
jgi:excisionase family DNA binding protein